jgi:hypothetical protein
MPSFPGLPSETMKYDATISKPPPDTRILVYGPGWMGAAIGVYQEEKIYGSYVVQPFLAPHLCTHHVTHWEELPNGKSKEESVEK